MSSSQLEARTSCAGRTAAILFACLAGSGCGGSAASPDVEFTAGPAAEQVPSVSAPSEAPPSDSTQSSTSTPAVDPATQTDPTSPAASTPGAAHNPKAAAATSSATAGSGSSSTDPSGTAGSGGAGSGADMTAGTGGSTAPADAAGTAASALSVTLTTVTQGGKYAPLNVGAIWIETTSGQWIDTLEYWIRESTRTG